MKNLRYLLNLFIILGFLLITAQTYGQSTAADNNNFFSVSQEIESAYDGQQQISGYPKYKHFARWKYWWSSRVNPDGSFHDVLKKNNEALSAWNKTEASKRDSEPTWNFIGPDVSSYANNGEHCRGNGYGRVDRIEFHPTASNKFYVSTPSGGAWYTADNGANWECLTDNLPIIGCAGLVVDLDDTNTLYLLTGTADNSLTDFVGTFGYRDPSMGIMKSTDHGENWEPILDFDTIVAGNVIPYRLKMHPLDSDVIVAATSQGLFISRNKGDTWVRELAQSRVDIEFHPTDENFMYVSGFNLMHYSDDKGYSWYASNNNPGCNGRRIEIAVSPDSPDDVWLLAGGVTAVDSFCGYSKSTDKGINFTNGITTPNIIGFNSSDQSNYDLCIAVDNNNDQRVIVGGIRIFRTDNFDSNPNNWNLIAPYFEPFGSQQGTFPSNYVHPDIHDVAYNPLNGNLYACGDGGIYTSSDNGTNWTNLSQGLHTAQIFHLNTAPSNSDKISIGLQDNGMKIRYDNSSQDFRQVNSGDGFDAAFYSANSIRVASSINNSVYLYPNTSDTLRVELTQFDLLDPWFQPVKFKHGDPDIIYRGDITLVRNNILNNVLTGTTILEAWASWEILTCPENDQIIYTAGGNNSFANDPNGRFYYYHETNGSFDRSNVTGFPNNLELVKITGIATEPGNCNNVAFTNGGPVAGEKVYYSTSNGGGTWQNLSYNLPNVPVHSIKIDSDGNFYVGTDLGVFYLPNGTTTWLPFYNNMPRVPVTDLEISNNGFYLYAATFGRGVWKSILPSSCSISKTVTDDLEGNNFFQSSSNIETSSNISGGQGTAVSMHAGDWLKLLPGFKVSTNSRFKALLTPCGTPPDTN